MKNIEFLYTILTSDNPVISINENLEKLLTLIPELKHEIGFNQNNPHHHLDVWNHTLLAISISENDFDVRLTLLLHDIGKPFSYQKDGEIWHYKGHPECSKLMSEKILKRIGFKDSYIKKICYLVEKHDNRITEDEIKEHRELILKRYEIQRCDALAHHPDKLEKRKEYLNNIEEKIKYMNLEN